ncbi:unnamed protein product [Lasius platythorax]|uniref:Uncharacterized protein n=1 Tax=Lasius platythorax TaxID=488582 RepID=A0AAV2MVK4_9HYME
MELARNFLAAKVDWQENCISDLHSEIKALKSLPDNSNVSTVINGGLSLCLISPDRIDRSPSIVRGDDAGSTQDLTLSRMSLTMVLSEEQPDKGFDDNLLVEEILRIEDSIVRINSEITSKTASLLEMDAAAESALTNIISPKDHGVSWQDSDRVGRARRRSEANRPRGGSTRISGHTTTAMDMDNVTNINLPSQGFRSPSGRRENPTVPEVPPSSSGEGPTSSLPTGGEYERATVETEVERDPLDLTFDCLSAMKAVPQLHQEAVVVSTPVTGSKRKARKVSPDAPSENEPGTSGTQRAPRAVLRKLRTRKRKPLEVNDRVEEISSASMSADSDWVLEREEGVNEDSDLEITGTQQLDVGSARKLRPKKKAPVRRSSSNSSSTRKDSDLEIAPKTNTSQVPSNKGKRKSRVRRKSLTSSEDEDEDSNFAPEELRAMGATAAGSLGLECINDVESERKNSPNGQVSGRMKKKLKRAKKIINTLVYKAEASGNPALLRLKNRELTDEVQSLKLNEVVIKRELEDMRSLVDNLRREISDLRDRVEEAEEDRRNSRESQRIMLWRHKKERRNCVRIALFPYG